MFNALSEFSYVVNMISLIPFLAWFFRPSNTNQIGTTCGLPSFLTVASFAVKVSCIRNFSISFLDISVIIAIMSNFLKSNFTYVISARDLLLQFLLLYVMLLLAF